MKSVVFTYGRFNPPHKGHQRMIEELINLANRTNKQPLVIVSHVTGNSKNPLLVENKIQILKKWFPNLNIIASSRDKSIAKLTQNFNKNSIMIVGQNRKNSFKFLPFNKMSVSRTNNAPSATKAREAALRDNKNTFRNLTGYNLTNNIRSKVKRSLR